MAPSEHCDCVWMKSHSEVMHSARIGGTRDQANWGEVRFPECGIPQWAVSENAVSRELNR